jgi:hypothetical protein
MPRIVKLKDGPHNLAAPTMYVTRALQRLGYLMADQFSILSLMLNVERGEKKTVDGKDFYPAVIADPALPVEWNLDGLADTIAALMRDPEWDSDRVADAMLPEELDNYYKAILALGEEAFGEVEEDPKVPS